MNARRPGTMIYFDLLNDLEDYTDEEVGKIFRATLNYGLNGEIPVFTDRGMKALWRNIQKAVDVDAHKYGEKVIQRKYAAYCKKAKANGEEPMLYDDWLNEQETEDNELQRVDNEIKRDCNENNESLNSNNEINQLSTINYQLPVSNNQQSNINIHSQSSGRNEAKAKYHPEWFDRFWSLYPKKKSKKDAIKAWDKLKPSLELCKVMDAALRKQMTWKQWQDPQFIPLPGTWIRGENWNDEDISKLEKKPEGTLVDWDNDDIFLK